MLYSMKSAAATGLVIMGLTLASSLQAEVWSGTKTFAEDTVFEADAEQIELSGEVTIEVAEGKTLSLSNNVTGVGGSIRAADLGRIVLAGANTFDGGVTIAKGYVRVASDTGLGTGKVTILGQREDYTGSCKLEAYGGVVGQKNYTPTLTIANPIDVTGNSTPVNSSLVIYNQRVVVTGKITAAQDFVFHDDGTSQRAINGAWYSIYQSIRAATFAEMKVKGGILTDGWSQFVFTGPVSAQYFYAPDGNKNIVPRESNYNATYEFQDSFTVKAYTNTAHDVTFKKDTVIPGAMAYPTGRGDKGLVTLAAGVDLTVGALSTGNKTDYNWNIAASSSSSSSMSTLTLTGVATDNQVESYFSRQGLNNKLSLVVDAHEGFTQTLCDRENSMSGAIQVKGGALVIDGASTFKNVPALTVDAGASLTLDSTANAAFAGVKTITVAGTLSLNANAFSNGFVFPNVTLDIKNTGSMTVEGGGVLPVKQLLIDGVAQPGGVFTSANCPGLGEGVSVFALPATAATVVWNGADALASTAMTSAGNWAREGTPDLSSGTAAVVIDEAATNHVAKMTYADGTFVNSISNAIPFVAGVDRVYKPFRIEPATPGGKLILYNGIQSYKGGFDSNNSEHFAQLVLSGHITLPPGVDGGNGGSKNKYAIRVRNSTFAKSAMPQGIIENSFISSEGNRSVPLVLDNATIDLPIYLYMALTQVNELVAYPNSTNVINGHLQTAGYRHSIAADNNAVLELRGGHDASEECRYLGPGEIRIINKPFTCDDNGGRTEGACKLVLDAEDCYVTGNDVREGFMHTSGSIEFKRSWCFSRGDMYFATTTESLTPINEALTMEFNATTQRVGRAYFNNNHQGSSLHGKYPAMLEMTGRIREGSYTVNPKTEKVIVGAPTNNIQVAGGLGFHVCGEGAHLPLGKHDFESCGDLEASAGTLELLPDATWLNGTNFTARGSGVLKFASAKQVNRNFAQLHLGQDGGRVYVPESTRVTFAAADIEGIPVPPDTYTANSDGVISGRILGGGTVRIGATGTVLYFR